MVLSVPAGSPKRHITYTRAVFIFIVILCAYIFAVNTPIIGSVIGVGEGGREVMARINDRVIRSFERLEGSEF